METRTPRPHALGPARRPPAGRRSAAAWPPRASGPLVLVLLALLLAAAQCQAPDAVCQLVPEGTEVPVCPPPEDDVVTPQPGWLIERPFPDIETLYDVTVVAEGNVYAVGTAGSIVHLVDGEWVLEESGTGLDLRGVSGILLDEETGEDLVFAVGDEGVVLKRTPADGWVAVPNAYPELLFDVWLRNRQDGYIVGDAGRILRILLVGEELQVEAMIAESTQIRLVPGNRCTPGNATCPTGTVCQADPNDMSMNPVTLCWNPARADGQIEESYVIPDPLKGVSGTGGDDVLAVGPRGAIYRFDGTSWTRQDSGTSRALSSVFTKSGTFVTAQEGVILQRAGGGWNPDNWRVPVPLFLQGVYVNGNLDTSEVYAVGLAGTVYYWHNGDWDPIDLDDDVHLRAIDGIVITPADGEARLPAKREVYAVGAGGRIVRGPETLPDGTLPEPEYVPPPE